MLDSILLIGYARPLFIHCLDHAYRQLRNGHYKHFPRRGSFEMAGLNRRNAA
jgi:hypothetical protein